MGGQGPQDRLGLRQYGKKGLTDGEGPGKDSGLLSSPAPTNQDLGVCLPPLSPARKGQG